MTGSRSRRPALIGGDGLFRSLEEGEETITLDRRGYEVMRTAANARIEDIARRNRPRASGPQASGGRSSARPRASSGGSSAVVETEAASGLMTYEGFPVRMSSGEPFVFTRSGWMKVDAFEASSLGTDELAAALAATAMMGSTARAYREGPS